LRQRMQKVLNAELVTLPGANAPNHIHGDGYLAKAQKNATPVSKAVPPARNINIFGKVKGLMVMLIGATLVGFGMGGYDAFRAALFLGLEILLLGFVWLAD